jgi:hypothetical protein
VTLKEFLEVRLTTIADCLFGSRSVSDPKCCQIGGPCCQFTRTVNLGIVWCNSPNSSEFGGLLVGHAAGPSVDLYNLLVSVVGLLYIIKIRYLTANDLFWMFCNLRHWLFWNTYFAFYTLHLWLSKQSTVLLRAHWCTNSLDYQICKTKYCWRSIEVQFHDVVMYVSCAVSNEKAATTSSMNYYHIAIVSSLPKIKLE